MCARGKHEAPDYIVAHMPTLQFTEAAARGQRHAVPQQALTKVVAAQALRGAKEGTNQVSVHQHMLSIFRAQQQTTATLSLITFIIVTTTSPLADIMLPLPSSASSFIIIIKRRPPSTMKTTTKATGLAFSVRGERRRIIPAITMPKRSNYSRTSREGEGERERARKQNCSDSRAQDTALVPSLPMSFRVRGIVIGMPCLCTSRKNGSEAFICLTGKKNRSGDVIPRCKTS